MDKEIETIAKKYKLDEKDENKSGGVLQSPLKTSKGEKLTHRAFDITSPPTLIHKRLEDKIKFLEIENQKLYKKLSEVKEKNKVLTNSLEKMQITEKVSGYYESLQNELEEKAKKIEECELVIKFYKEELQFVLQSSENDIKIKSEEIQYLKTQVEYFKTLPNIENISLIRENTQKLYRDIEVLKLNCMVQEELIEKLKNELSKSNTQQSQEILSLNTQLKKLQNLLDSEKSSKASLSEQTLSLNASLKSLQYELELQKSRTPKFFYTPLIPNSNSNLFST